jgi:hypothetical protein
MRRLFSMLLAVAMLANLAAWPAAALAEVLEHQQEQTQLFDPAGAPAEPAGTYCRHGCAGHFSQHFQGQPGYASIVLRVCGVEQPLPFAHIPFSQLGPVPPFRPPLGTPDSVLS